MPITDLRMTRFWITLPQAVEFVLRSFATMQGGELYVPRIPSMKVVDLAQAIAPGCTVQRIGIRSGEKLHEVLVSEDEARHTVELPDRYVVQPPEDLWFGHTWSQQGAGLAEGFSYSSDTNTRWLSEKEIRELIRPFEDEAAGKA